MINAWEMKDASARVERPPHTKPFERVQNHVLALLVPFLVANSSVIMLIGTGLDVLGLPARIGALAINGLVLIGFLVVLPAIFRTASRAVWLSIFIALYLFALSTLSHYTPPGFSMNVGLNLLFGLGWMACAAATRDFAQCRSYLYIVAPIILISTVVQLTRSSSSVGMGQEYSQYLAYSLLPAVLIFVDAAFHRARLFNAFLALSSGILMISIGARGPFIAALIFVLLRVGLHLRTSPRLRLAIVLLSGPVILVGLRFYNFTLVSIQLWLEGQGLSTRVSDRLIKGTLMEDQARKDLVENTLELIAENPILGMGMANERPVLAERMGRPVDEALGWYPHNLFLELLVQFGVVVGTLFIVVLIVGILRVVLKSWSPDRRRVTLLFVGIGLLPLLFSASYLGWPEFFALLGLCLSRGLATESEDPQGELAYEPSK